MPLECNYRFTLYPIKQKDSNVWTYQITTPEGIRENRRSTGIRFNSDREKKRSKITAEKFIRDLCISRSLGITVSPKKKTNSMTLNEWVKQAHWWEWDKCNYIWGELARSEDDRAAITKNYAEKNRRILNAQILPIHGYLPLTKISVKSCEELLRSWAKEKSFKTANNYRTVYSTMLTEAARLELIPFNPWKSVKALIPRKKKFGALSIDEGRKLLHSESIDSLWEGKFIFYMITKLAFMSGLRIGEVLGLQVSDVHSEKLNKAEYHYISVNKQWLSQSSELGPTKTKDHRNIPIHPMLYQELLPFLQHQGFLFSFEPHAPGRQLIAQRAYGEHPVSATRVRLTFSKALDLLGIDETKRKERNIVFHSARRFANTLWRMNGVPDHVVRAWTGHRVEAMSEHYTDYLPQDMDFIIQAQSKL